MEVFAIVSKDDCPHDHVSCRDHVENQLLSGGVRVPPRKDHIYPTNPQHFSCFGNPDCDLRKEPLIHKLNKIVPHNFNLTEYNRSS